MYDPSIFLGICYCSENFNILNYWSLFDTIASYPLTNQSLRVLRAKTVGSTNPPPHPPPKKKK